MIRDASKCTTFSFLDQTSASLRPHHHHLLPPELKGSCPPVTLVALLSEYISTCYTGIDCLRKIEACIFRSNWAAEIRAIDKKSKVGEFFFLFLFLCFFLYLLWLSVCCRHGVDNPKGPPMHVVSVKSASVHICYASVLVWLCRNLNLEFLAKVPSC